MTKRVLIFAITFVLAAITLPSSAANNVMYVNYAQNSKFDLSEVGSLRSIIADLAPAIPALTDQNATSQINSIPITASLPESCSGQSQYLTDLQAVIRGYSAEKLSIGFLQTNKNLPQAFDVTLVDESNCKKIDFFTIKKTADYWIQIRKQRTSFMEELNSNPAHFASLGTNLVFATKNGDLYSTTTTKLQVTPTTTNFSGENINYTSNHPGVKSILMDSSQVLIAIASNSSNCNRIELFRLAKIGTSIRNKKLIYKMPGCFNSATTDLNGSGGRLVWADSLHKSVYLSVGMADIWRGDEQITPNQNYGVIINIDLKTGASKLISRGHRNPQGLCVNARGTIIETEQGPEGGDELNVIKNGGHYGWPYTSYGYPYADFPFSPTGRNFGAHTGSYINPIFAWIPSIAASSLICPTNQAPSKWKNYYFMGTLRDESLHVIKIEKNSVLFDERIYLGQRIRDLDWVGLGVLAILTDSGEFIQIRFLER